MRLKKLIKMNGHPESHVFILRANCMLIPEADTPCNRYLVRYRIYNASLMVPSNMFLKVYPL